MDEQDLFNWCYSLEMKISLAKSQGEIFLCLRQEMSALGFNRFSCLISHVVPFVGGDVEVIGNFPDEWVGYCLRGRLVLHDPVVELCAKNNGVAVWERDDVCSSEVAVEALAQSGIDFGMSCVVSPARCTRGIFSLARSGFVVSEQDFCFLKERLKIISLLVVDRLISVGKISPRGEQSVLSYREIQVLRCVADGETSKQIARSLDISNDTVNFHLKNIFQKLGACNKAQAAAYAAIYGLI